MTPTLETRAEDGSWLVRVVPNLYPAFEGNAPFVVTNRGPVFTQATAGGTHEVIVLSPDHQNSWSMLSDEQTTAVMTAISDRIEEHSTVPGLRYSQAIVNAGREAGASIEHPHGQLLGMSFVPRELVEEQAGFARFAGRCLLCTAVDAEENVSHRVVYADERVLVICPFWSGAPYEMLVIPRAHGPHLHHSPPADLVAVGRALKVALGSLRDVVGRRRLQPGVPLRPLPGPRAVPLARPRGAQDHHGGRVRAGHRRDDQHREPRAGRRGAGWSGSDGPRRLSCGLRRPAPGQARRAPARACQASSKHCEP